MCDGDQTQYRTRWTTAGLLFWQCICWRFNAGKRNFSFLFAFNGRQTVVCLFTFYRFVKVKLWKAIYACDAMRWCVICFAVVFLWLFFFFFFFSSLVNKRQCKQKGGVSDIFKFGYFWDSIFGIRRVLRGVPSLVLQPANSHVCCVSCYILHWISAWNWLDKWFDANFTEIFHCESSRKHL